MAGCRTHTLHGRSSVEDLQLTGKNGVGDKKISVKMKIAIVVVKKIAKVTKNEKTRSG